MTPADLKIRREALGLSQQWMAKQLGVQDRAVRRWEAGDRTIPRAVAVLLTDIEQKTADVVASTVFAVDHLMNDMGEDPQGLDIAAYETDESLWAVHPNFAPLGAAWHRAMLGKVADNLDVEVVFHFAPSNVDPESTC